MKITLRHLSVFAAVAAEGGIAAAARHLRLSQAAISETISDLEEILDQQLFERGRGSLRLNAAGLALRPRAAALFRLADGIERDHRARRAHLRIGASVTVGDAFLPALLGKTAKDHPELDFTVIVRNSQAVADAVERVEVAIGIVEDVIERPALLSRPWRRDDLVLIAASGHRLAGVVATPSDLEGEVWVLRETGSGTRATFNAAAAGHFEPGRVALTAGGNGLLRTAVADGIGIGCLSRAAVVDDIGRGRLAEVFAPWMHMSRVLSVILPVRWTAEPALTAMLRHCRATADPEFSRGEWGDEFA